MEGRVELIAEIIRKGWPLAAISLLGIVAIIWWLA